MTLAAQDVGAPLLADAPIANESPPSAVSWAAVLAGAVVASAASLVLIALGSGLGFAGSSPWPGIGPSLATFTILAGLWLIVTQWVASGVGGYVTGRLRTRWTGVHTHEVFFRDTAHGFLTWSMSTLLVAVLVAAAGSLAASTSAPSAAPFSYEADALLRAPRGDLAPVADRMHADVMAILARAPTKTGVSQDDQDYLASVVSARTGLSRPAAESRVEATFASVRTAADDARKAASAMAIFTALAMVIGAFIASVAAALGGQQRDEHP